MVARGFCVCPLSPFFTVCFSYICTFHSHLKEGKGLSLGSQRASIHTASPAVKKHSMPSLRKCLTCLSDIALERGGYCNPILWIKWVWVKLLKPAPGGVTHGAIQFLWIAELKRREREQKRKNKWQSMSGRKNILYKISSCRVTIQNLWLQTGYQDNRRTCSKTKF